MKELTEQELDEMVAFHQAAHECELGAVEIAEIRDMYATSYVDDLRQLKGEIMRKIIKLKEKS